MQVLRRCGLVAAALIAAIALALGLAMASDSVATRLANGALRANGADARVERAALGIGSVELRGLQLTDLAHVERIAAAFSLRDLLRGNLRELVIEGPVLTLGGGTDRSGPGTLDGMPALRIERLRVRGGEARLSVPPGGGPAVARFRADLRLELPDWASSQGHAQVELELPDGFRPGFAAGASGRARIDARLEAGVLEIRSTEPVELEIDEPSAHFGGVSVSRVTLRGSDRGSRIRVPLARDHRSVDSVEVVGLEVAIEDLAGPSLRMDRARFGLEGHVQIRGDRLRIASPACSAFQVDGLARHDVQLSLLGCVSTGGSAVELDCGAGCRPREGELEVRVEQASARVGGARWSLREGALRAQLRGGELADLAVELIELADDGGAVHENPLRFRGQLRVGELLLLSGTLEDIAAGLEAAVDARLQPGGQARVQVTLQPVRFERGGLQPASLSRHLAGLLPPLDGSIAAVLDASFGGEAPSTQLDLVIDRASFTGGGARLDALSGLVHFDSLDPPRVPHWQVLSFDALGAGADLRGGVLAFRIEDGRLEILHAETGFGGGALRAAGSTDLAAVRHAVDLQLDGVSAGALAELAALEGLEVSGKLSGNLPLRVDASGVQVERGRVVSTSGGHIRYRPASLPAAIAGRDPSTELLRRALEDLHYETLEILVDGRSDEELRATLHLRGHNPAVASGRPIELNVNLTGDLAALLRAPLALVELPGTLYLGILEAVRE